MVTMCLCLVKTVPTNSGFVDCSDVMPELATPVPQQGNTTGLGPKTPLKNRGIYLQRGDRLYVGVLQRGVYNTASGYIPWRSRCCTRRLLLIHGKKE